jgi:type I restriction enzyme S subunit
LTDGLVSEIAEFITDEALANSSAKVFPAGTLLIALYGATVGKLGVLTRAAATNQAVCAIFPPPEVEGKFLFWYLRHRRADLIAQAVGGAQPNISQSILRSVDLPVPPVEDQRSIVAEIEKQLSRLDEAVTSLKRVKANLKRYNATALKAAVEGRLDFTGVKTVRAEERKGWRNVFVGDVAQIFGGLTKSPKRQTYAQQLPYLRVANVYANELRLDHIERIGVSERELERLLLRRGDLLVVEGNGSPDQIGRVALWDGSIPNCVHQNHLIKVRFQQEVLPKWALIWLLSPGGRHEIEKVSSSTSGLHTLSTGKVRHLPLPLPPLDVQHKIVLEIERRFSLVREVEAEVDANLNRAETLRQSILSAAFSGRTPFEH